MSRIAVLQMTSGIDPQVNAQALVGAIGAAAMGGAEMLFTPEMSGLIDRDRARATANIVPEDQSPVLAAVREAAAAAGVWIALGSIPVLREDGRWANRALVIDGGGAIAARYDKIHMFDVNVSDTEVYRESEGYRPGSAAVVAKTPFARIGMTVCYDVRFPALYRRLAQAGAQVITVPAAFNHITGAAHWETLLRARAIETGCFVLAPAQTGFHPETLGKGRRTHGHSLAIAPWGEILADAGTEPGVTLVDLDLARVAEARRRVPSLSHDRGFDGP